jgi:hypothetical protein
MYLAADYIHPTPHKGRCRVRIYRPDLPEEGSAARDEAVVICTELKDNAGMSITNAAEQIAGEVLASHPDVFDPFSLGSIPGIEYDKPFVWIEHYLDGARSTPDDPATFDLVEFSHYEPKEVLRSGKWRKEIGGPPGPPSTAPL